MISKYDTNFVLGVKFDFLDVGIFGDIICFDISLKNEFFRSCFRQSAKCKMTAQTRRRNHVFSKNLTL